MADIAGESSNPPDALFHELQDWEEQLKSVDLPSGFRAAPPFDGPELTP